MSQHTKPPIQSESERRHDAACRSMWSEHALVRAYCAEHGPGPFALRNLIDFTTAMDQDAFDATQGEGAR
jgi:hypothetical protein